jgi:hypothetical protein
MAGKSDGPTEPTEPTPPVVPAESAGVERPVGQSTATKIGEVLGATTARLEKLVRDPARRKPLIGAVVGLGLVVVLLAALPALTRRAAPTPAPSPAAQAPAEGQPAPAEGQPAPSAAQPAAPAESGAPAAQPPSIGRAYLLAALPLLLGLFWLLSAWLVDSEARRAFVVQEPWGERRTIAYTALAVGCVFPLILAGLIFSAWGFVTFLLDVSRRQSPLAALQAASLILMICAGFLLVRGLIAQWLDKRRATRT